MKRIIQSGRHFIVGGRRCPAYPHCRSSYRAMKEAGVLPPIVLPDSIDYSVPAAVALAKLYLNDQLGDCVIAGGMHIRGVTSANSTGKPVLFSDQQVVGQYSVIGGYDPSQTDGQGNNPTDQGCDEQTAINSWEQNGWPDGVVLENAVSVDVSNPIELREALYWFENVMYGVELPDAYVNPFPAGNGFVWDVAGQPDPANGHCFISCGYNAQGTIIDTWGMIGTFTYAANAMYATRGLGGQCFALLPADVVSKVTGKSPAGFDDAALKQYLESL